MKEALKYLQTGAIVPVDMETTILLVNALKEALAQPEQEPVAWLNKERNTIIWDKIYPDMYPLYTTPPQRPWVDLTDEEVMVLNRQSYDAQIGLSPLTFYRAIEAKLKEKNT